MNDELKKELLKLDDNGRLIFRLAVYGMMARLKEVEKYYAEIIDVLKDER